MNPRRVLAIPLAAILAVSAALALGCSHNVQIPPSRPLTLEAPKTVGAGQSRGRLQIGSHGALFNGTFDSGDLRFRRGLSDRLELSVDGSLIAARDNTTDTNMYLGRLGGKINPFATENFAITAGLGGGLSPAAGKMVSADGGVIVGYHNRYVVPYAQITTFMSAPIDAREVRTGQEPDEVDTPTLTAGTGLTLGLAVIRDRYTISVGLDQTLVRDEDGDEGFMSIGAALELAIE